MRIGKFLSVDPLTKDYPWYTPYQFAGNKPITALDIDGLEEYDYTFYFKSAKSGMVELMNPNSLQTLNGRDDNINGAGSFTAVQELTRQDLVNILGYSHFVFIRLYRGNVDDALLDQSNAGPRKSSSSMIDFKNRLYELFDFNRQDLIKIDGTTYNANEAGNYVWSFVLQYFESRLDPEAVAEVGSWTSFRHDEANEKKAIQAGQSKAKTFVLTKDEAILRDDISERYYQDYDYFYDDSENEYKKFTPSNTLGIMKLYRERYNQPQVTLSKDPNPRK